MVNYWQDFGPLLFSIFSDCSRYGNKYYGCQESNQIIFINAAQLTIVYSLHMDNYYMARQFERSDWFFLGRDFAIRTVSLVTVITCVIFLFSKAGKFKSGMARVPYSKLLTNLASTSRTGEYWPSVVFVRTATTSGQYSPLRPSRSVSKRF